MSDLNSLIKMQAQSRRSGESIIITAKKRGCSCCGNRKKLITVKINKILTGSTKP